MRLGLARATGLLWLAAAVAAVAMPAPDTGPDAVRAEVAEATHVVIGTVTDVAAVTFYNNILYRMNPQPSQLSSHSAAQLTLRVDEVLYPPGWSAAAPVKYLLGGGLYSLKMIGDDVLNRQRIFLLRAQDDNRILDKSQIFFAAGAGSAALPLSERGLVERLLAQRPAPAIPSELPQH